MAVQRVWIGTVAEDHESEHEELVSWLASPDGDRMLRQYRLAGYELRQHERDLMITMEAAEPPIIIHFLRNPRAWPTFWEFRSNAPADGIDQAEIRFQWQVSSN